MRPLTMTVFAILAIGCAATPAIPTDSERRQMDGANDVEPEVEPTVVVSTPDELKSGATVDEPDATVWCFRLTDEMLVLFPNAAETLEQVGLQWGVEIVVSNDCSAELDVGVIADERYPYGAWTGRDIVVNSFWADNKVILDIDQRVCVDDYGGARILLRDVLIHELGHALGFEHNETALMTTPVRYCHWLTMDGER